MVETLRRAGRWLWCLAVALVLGSVALWMGINAWESSRVTANTPFAQMTLKQLGEPFFWGLGALVVAVFAWGMWENRNVEIERW